MNEKSFVIGITGHRSLPPESLPSIQQEVKSFYEKIKQQHPTAEITVLSSLAAGADTLCTGGNIANYLHRSDIINNDRIFLFQWRQICCRTIFFRE